LAQFFPAVGEFIPARLTESVFHPENQKSNISLSEISKDTVPVLIKTDTTAAACADTLNPDPGSDSLLQIDVHSRDFLAGFVDSLKSSKGQVRIIYYGDSQIEGDRMTSYLRQNLRKRSGGSGPGLFLPVMPIMYTKTTWIRSSPNWRRYNYLSYKNGEISHRRFGPFMVICRYLPEGELSASTVKAWVKIKPSAQSDSLSSLYDSLRIFYGNNEGNVNVSVYAAGKEVYADSLRHGNDIKEISCRLDHSTEIKIEFSGNVSPDIYGMSIESSKGLIVDNIPQRGSAGLEFTMVDKKNLAESYRMLSPDLFILQYGLNVVRNVRDDYSFYKTGLSRQLALIKEVSPGTPVLVMGLTDMASKEGDSIRSYRNIPSIIEAQKEAVREQGDYFWNSYMAMGGKGSIIKWADKKPPLAQKDLVHLTYEGADTLSEMLTDSLLYEKKAEPPVPSRTEIRVAKDTVTEAPKAVTITTEKKPVSILIENLFRYDPERPMIFSAPYFWIFLLVILAFYSLIYKKLFIRNFYLFLISLFFYYKSGGLFLFLLIFVILVDFTAGLIIGRSERKAVRRLFIILSIVSNIGILAYFKYTGFIVSSINDLFGTHFQVYDFLANFSNSTLGTSFNVSNIILPVGISFFTFQSLSYTLDVYRRKIMPVRNIIDFGFYVSFFPQLVAGPIVRASEFIPQIYMKYHLDKREFSHALYLIAKGLIKKVIISDFIAVNFIDRVFDAPSIYSGFENLMAIYGYGLQIYCDFSGYTDIAIGLGLIFGFRLPVNFNSPYKAEGVSDFWKRWHISLSRWLKDYLYIPLGGNRKGRFRTYINLMITMLLGGLWHGADLRFIIWGFLHGAGLVINRIWNSIFGENIFQGKAGKFLVVFLTFQFVSFCWIFFRAPDLDSVKIMLTQIFQNFSPGAYSTVATAYSSVFMLIGAGYLIHFLPERIKESYRGLFIKMPVGAQVAVMMLMAVILFQMRSTDILPFIYFRF
jgi:D-alanyl-lipoteichoic acid acyltransferase DltB (MBOAT superfamily)